jgi:hypothetical protein
MPNDAYQRRIRKRNGKQRVRKVAYSCDEIVIAVIVKISRCADRNSKKNQFIRHNTNPLSFQQIREANQSSIGTSPIDHICLPIPSVRIRCSDQDVGIAIAVDI